MFIYTWSFFFSFDNIFRNYGAREIRIGVSAQQCNLDTWETSSFSLAALRGSNDNLQPAPIWSQWKGPSWLRLVSVKGPESTFPGLSAFLISQCQEHSGYSENGVKWSNRACFLSVSIADSKRWPVYQHYTGWLSVWIQSNKNKGLSKGF